MSKTTKILVAGVGGQGVVFLTNLIVKSAMIADIPVATSEIHGLAQRGGSVTAGLAIYDTIKYVKSDVVTICVGLAASMGAFLLAAGTKGKELLCPTAE